MAQLRANPELASLHRLVKLDWTLNTRPALAQKVRELSILLVATVHFNDIIAPRFMTDLAVQVALLLDRVPGLERLLLRVKLPFETPEGAWADCLDKMHPPQLAGFSTLKSLATNFVPPRSILVLPTLRSLHIDTRDIDPCLYSRQQLMELFEDNMVCDDGSAKLASKIVNLIMDLHIDILNVEYTDLGSDDTYEFLAYLPSTLEALESLQLRLCHAGELRNHTEVADHSYHELMPFFAQRRLQTVMIDTCDVRWSRYVDDESGLQNAGWGVHDVIAEEIDCLYDSLNEGGCFHSNNIAALLSLRRLVVPQEALFFHYEQEILQRPFSPTPLPPSLESIEIISPTRALNRWARYVLDNPANYPNLKQVVLWCDPRHAPQVFDRRLRPAGMPHAGSGFNRWEDTVPETVWDKLKETGISLVTHMDRSRGWRKDI
ncbi:hypothetical protein N0V90_001104 [Kalmusia sp. IMI 367209]|nr:hypothetical protein N0V90_001104 [Kalmusia sp. IMI 367209]